MLFAATPPPVTTYDDRQIPTIVAASESDLFFAFGQVLARQRGAQMDRSRRAAEGRLAESFGPQYAAADAETLRFSPSDAELRAQYRHLPPRLRVAFDRYADGVNAAWSADGAAYAPWRVEDSLAIAVRLLRVFGRGGSGELRNLALLSYLQGRPESRERALDIFDDLAPYEDPKAPTTLQPEDEPRFRPPVFARPVRSVTEAQLAALPRLSLLESLGAARVASLDTARAAAARVASPFRSGSYAVAVARDRSASGVPLLLTGPQMGFSLPSVAHEIGLRGPRFAVAGMDVPGIPLILVGATQRVAWGLTTGVADTEDIVALPAAGAALTIEHRDYAVNGTTPGRAIRETTPYGEIVFRTGDGKTLFARRRSYEGRELESLTSLFGMYEARSAHDCDRTLARATMNFNAIYAAPDAIGWRYTGLVPKRDPGYDPRLPTPPAAKWHGFLSPSEMPHVIAPKSGIISNWNTKPSRGWVNGDTPAWGRADRVNLLRTALQSRRGSLAPLGPQDLVYAAKWIAEHDVRYLDFSPYLSLGTWDSGLISNATAPLTFARGLEGLKRDVFAPVIGDVAGQLTAVVQDSALMRALEGDSRVFALTSERSRTLAAAALARAGAPEGYAPPRFSFDDAHILTYTNRGTFLGVTELGRSFETSLPPGNVEAGEDAFLDLADANDWRLRPRVLPWTLAVPKSGR